MGAKRRRKSIKKHWTRAVLLFQLRYLCIFQEIVETVKRVLRKWKALSKWFIFGRLCWEHTYHWKLSKFVHGDLISIRIPLIRNLHILCHVSALLTDGWNFTLNLCKMCWNWNKYLFILRPCASCYPDSALTYSTFLPLFSKVFYLCCPSSLHSTFLFHISVGFFLRFWRVLRRIVQAATLRK